MSEHDHHNHHEQGMFPLTPLKWDPALRAADLTPHPVPQLQAGVLPTANPQVRKDQKTLSEPEIKRLQRLFHRMMVEKPQEYRTLVDKHNMKWDMHSNGQVGRGTFRFLPWHRMYLWETERALQQKEAEWFGSQESPLTLPYWRWVDPFPEWLPEPFPYPDPNEPEFSPAARRRTLDSALKPGPEHVQNLMQHWSTLYTFPDSSDYLLFTVALEVGREPERGAPPVSFPVRSHNHVHNHVGGLMTRMQSPSDPVFWLHHAEVDRLWWIWQQDHPHETPPARDVEKLEPFPGGSYQKVHDIQTLGYTYDSQLY